MTVEPEVMSAHVIVLNSECYNDVAGKVPPDQYITHNYTYMCEFANPRPEREKENLNRDDMNSIYTYIHVHTVEMA